VKRAWARLVPQLWAAVPGVLMLLACASAWARPGGGQSYSGHRDDYGGGGGSGGGGDFTGEIVYLLIRLVFYYPKVGLPLLIIVGVVLYVAWRKRERLSLENWTSTHAYMQQQQRPAYRTQQAQAHPKLQLDALLRVDPDFSASVFEDFAYRLYASAYRAHSDRRALESLAPYLSSEVRSALSGEAFGGAVTQVIVGSLRIGQVEVPGPSDGQTQSRVTVEYESNVIVGSQRTFYLREQWTLARDRSARTRPPEETERLGCPSCGAPFESTDSARCKYCNQVVSNGRFDWSVTARRVLSREPRPPALTSDVPEVGTNAPSLVSPDQNAAFAQLVARDPALDEADLLARLRLIFEQLNRAYSELDLQPVRGFLSDGMFDYLRYWTDAYRAQGLRNVLEGTQLTRTQRVRVRSDRYFDAITFRIWASGLDYTIDVRTQRTVTGSADRPRSYSEYWTLLRAAGTSGRAHSEAQCPSCAAPLEVTMAGNCRHCSAHITRGEFDWVLSKIEQDEAYEG
jgi:predicted lipid-binding transport protein (Tim44 family)